MLAGRNQIFLVLFKDGVNIILLLSIKGNESSQDEKAASAINALKLDEEVGGKAIQVRVVQGMEPRHFIKMFGGKMVVFSGGKVIQIERNILS